MINIISNISKAKINSFIGKPLPIKLTLAVTFMCNSKCKTCNIWEFYKKSPEKIKDELSIEELKKLFNDLGNYLSWVEFTGGEPFIRKDISEIIIYAYKNTKILAGGVTTNGILSKRVLHSVEKIINNIPNNKILNVGISLDGVSTIHDEIRGIKGSFDKAVWLFNELENLRQEHENLTIHFAYTISQYNAGRFEEFYNFIKENYNVSINKITVTFEHFTDYYGHKNDENLYKTKAFKNNILKDVNCYLKISKNENSSKDMFYEIKTIFYKFYLKNIQKYINEPKKLIIPCVAGKYSAYIDPYGNVYPCTQWLNKLGNIKEKSFKDIWWNHDTEKIRKLIKNGKCPNCWTPCEAQPSWVMNFGLLRGWW